MVHFINRLITIIQAVNSSTPCHFSEEFCIETGSLPKLNVLGLARLRRETPRIAAFPRHKHLNAMPQLTLPATAARNASLPATLPLMTRCRDFFDI
jgi:hypothetical protein